MKIQFITAPPPPSGEAGRGLLLLLAFAYAMLLPACHKDPPDPPVPPPAVLPDTLPPLTTVGANTFGCYVNGKLWLPKADWKAYFDPAFSPIQSFLNEGDKYTAGYLSLGYSVDNIRQSIGIGWPGNLYTKKVFHTNEYSLNDQDAFTIWYLDHNNSKWYYSDGTIKNTRSRMEITHFDTSSNIISGKITVTLYRGSYYDKITNRKDSIVITDGRFDIRYHQ